MTGYAQNNNWSQLTKLLAHMLVLFQALLKLSQEKQKVLVDNEVAALEEITRREEQLLIRLGQMEIERNAHLKVLEGGRLQQLPLSELIVHADAACRSELEQALAQFQEITQELNKVNTVNTQLLEQALQLIDFNMNIMVQTQAGPTYQAGGDQGEQVSKQRIFDIKA